MILILAIWPENDSHSCQQLRVILNCITLQQPYNDAVVGSAWLLQLRLILNCAAASRAPSLCGRFGAPLPMCSLMLAVLLRARQDAISANRITAPHAVPIGKPVQISARPPHAGQIAYIMGSRHKRDKSAPDSRL